MNSTIEQQYTNNFPILHEIKKEILKEIQDTLKDIEHIDRIYGRVKSIESFIKKSEKNDNGVLLYPDPFLDIQDQIGIRVIVFYLKDKVAIKDRIESAFNFIERDEKVKNESEFGYEAIHYTLEIPPHIISKYKNLVKNEFFELQICTMFQHAWSEANHDVMYKNNHSLANDQKRKLYWVAAQSWGADRIIADVVDHTCDDSI